MAHLTHEQSFFLFLLALGFLAAALAPRLARLIPQGSGILLSVLPLTHFLFLLKLSPAILRGEAFGLAIPWISEPNIPFAFRIDGLSLLFGLLVSGIGTFIVLYGSSYFKGDPKIGRFYGLILAFFTAMQGLVMADGMLVMFLFWELTSVTSYLLIGFKNEEEEARQSALRALMVTGAGGLCLLVGLIVLQHLGGSGNFSGLPTDLFARNPDWLLPCLLLIAAGAMTKSAQFPFHFWLPGAMAAPTPVSAYLHSATMVKAGIYLLFRLQPLFGRSEAWLYLFGIAGATTMVLGSLMALGQRDLKRLLAYTTISALGTITMLLGLGLTTVALLFLVVHALYKASGFLIVGIVDHETGTRDLEKLGGLSRALPLAALAAGLAAGSMAGLPPFLGFIAKESIYEATWQSGSLGLALTTLAFIANAATVAAALMLAYEAFGQARQTREALPKAIHEPLFMAIGPLLLAGLGLAGGLLPGLVSTLLESASRHALPALAGVKLGLWHGFNLVLLLSALTLGSGVVFFSLRNGLRRRSSHWARLSRPFAPSVGYERGMRALLRVAHHQTRLLHHGYLRHYVATIFAFALLTVGLGGILRFRPDIFSSLLQGFSPSYPLLLALIVIAVGSILKNESRLNSLIKLGFIGLGVTLVFALYGAPDLALTQVLIEVLTVILFVLVVYRLPRIRRLSSRAVHVRDGILALSMGTMMTLMILHAQRVDLFPSIAGYFGENSYVRAFGKNVVNVILVDFRGFDTLGEISVLAMTAIGLTALLRRRDS